MDGRICFGVDIFGSLFEWMDGWIVGSVVGWISDQLLVGFG
jgi:hypothetical protein